MTKLKIEIDNTKIKERKTKLDKLANQAEIDRLIEENSLLGIMHYLYVPGA